MQPVAVIIIWPMSRNDAGARRGGARENGLAELAMA